jgi:hypothetical protein
MRSCSREPITLAIVVEAHKQATAQQGLLDACAREWCKQHVCLWSCLAAGVCGDILKWEPSPAHQRYLGGTHDDEE